MEQYVIKGGNPLVGDVEIAGAKNAALPIFADGVDGVEFLPGEELDLAGDRRSVEGRESLGDGARCAAHVTVCGGLAVDGGAQFQAALYGMRTHVEYLGDAARDLTVGHVDLGGAVGVHTQAHRLGHANGIRYLHQCTRGHTGCHQILGYMAGGIGGRTVDLAGVFAREGTAAVGAVASVGVDDNLAAGEAGVAIGATDHEFACRIDQQLDIIAHKRLDAVG